MVDPPGVGWRRFACRRARPPGRDDTVGGWHRQRATTCTTRAYFDAADAAPLHPVARQALVAALADGWADPAKLYAEGRRAAQLLDAARAAIADCLGTRPDEVTFCASGSQAAQLAIAGVRARRAAVGAIAVHSAIEHSSVLRAAGARPVAAVSGRSARSRRPGRVGRRRGRAGVAVAAVQIAPTTRSVRVQPIAAVAAACDRRRRAAVRGRGPVGRPGSHVPRRVVGADRRARSSGAARPASACSWCARAPGGLGRGRSTGRIRGPCRCRSWSPRRRRCGRASGRGGRERPAVRARRPHPGRRRGRPCPTSRSSATRSIGCRTSSRSRACTSTARRCCTRWTGTASRSRPARRVRRRRSSRRTCWRRWAC